MASGAAAMTSSGRPPWDAAPTSPALERFYRQLMAVDQLPSSPAVAQRMMVTINKDDVNVRDIAGLIEKDQSLAARLLRLANSSFFATRTKVTSIQHAVTLLGFGRVRDIVLGLSVWGALDAKSKSGKRYRQTLWKHAATVAAASKRLGERTGLDAGAAFTAGLLHDVGKLVLGLRLGETYWTMLDEAHESGASAKTVEIEAFGCHHGTVGGWLLQLWQLPNTLADTVALHEELLVQDYGMDMPNLVGIADRLVNATDPDTHVVLPEVLEEVHAFAPGLLTHEYWQELYAGLVAEQEVVAGILDA